MGAIDVNGGNLSGAGCCSTNFGAATGYESVNHPCYGCVLRDGAVYPYTGRGIVHIGQESYEEV